MFITLCNIDDIFQLYFCVRTPTTTRADNSRGQFSLRRRQSWSIGNFSCGLNSSSVPQSLKMGITDSVRYRKIYKLKYFFLRSLMLFFNYGFCFLWRHNTVSYVRSLIRLKANKFQIWKAQCNFIFLELESHMILLYLVFNIIAVKQRPFVNHTTSTWILCMQNGEREKVQISVAIIHNTHQPLCKIDHFCSIYF